MKNVKLCVLPLLFVFVSAYAVAQQQVVGRVVDANDEGIIGANVVVKESSIGTITDLDGQFVLNCDPTAVLEISYVGYLTKEVSAAQSPLKIVLDEDSRQLDEVVVVGYGAMRKSDLTGSVASVGEKTMLQPVSNIGQALQGQVAGLSILDNGAPGDNVNIKIRGLGSINNCDPLVVIDGVPTDLGLNSINMLDVDHIDILKDASATAIYGSRGANGVIIITTKKGSDGKGKVTLNAGVGMQTPMHVPSMLNAAQYAALNNDMMLNAGMSQNPLWADPTTITTSTDWLKEMFHMGLLQNYQLAYSGGSDKGHYYLSVGYQKNDGIVKTTDYQRFTLQENSDVVATKWLHFTHSLLFSADTKKSGEYSIGDAMNLLPTQAIKNEDGTYAGPEGNAEWYGSTRNVVGTMDLNSRKTSGFNLLTNLAAEITFCPQFKFKTMFGFDGKFWFDDNFTPAYPWKPTPVEESARYQSSHRSLTYTWDNYFTYDQVFKEKHHLNIMAGMSMQWNNYQYMDAQKNVFEFDNVHEFDNGIKMNSIGGTASDWALMSFMGRINYNYADRYLVTATVRGDGSSRFGKNKRWGVFPSGAVAWRMTKEEWFPETEGFNDFKIRAGYGMTGSQASVGNYDYLAAYNTSVYPLGIYDKEQAALISVTLANPNLHWETVEQINLGFDMALAYNRLFVNFDWYWKNTKDMLVKASIPITAGFEDVNDMFANAGKVSNRGFELSLRSINLKNTPVKWETTVSLTFNQNKIVDLNSDKPFYTNQINNSYVTILEKGLPINCFYGYVTDGIFQNQEEVANHAYQPGAAAGDIRYRDLNNDGVINDDDRTVIGNPNPQWMFSMGNTLTWKGLEFSFLFQGVAGNDIYNANNITNTGMSAAYNQTTAVLDRWTPTNPSTTMPRAVYGDPNGNCRVSNRFVEDGSYLRLKNITLAYNFPNKLMQKAHLQGIRLAFSAENVATISNYSGFDPEVALNGIDLNRYPLSRTYNFSLNFNF